MTRITVNDTEDKEKKETDGGKEPVEQEEMKGSLDQIDEATSAPSREDLLEKLRQAEESAKKNYDLYVRSQADMENMKRRFQREKEDWIRFANESLIKELLPVMDNLDKAISHSKAEGSLESLREGVELTLKGLKSSLEKAGLKEVKALGENFDPNFHEAMVEQEDHEVDSGTVLQEYQRGYLLNDRLIRPSLVVVSRRPAEKGRPGED